MKISRSSNIRCILFDVPKKIQNNINERRASKLLNKGHKNNNSVIGKKVRRSIK